MDPRTSLDTKEQRKISTPLTPGIEPGPSSPQPSALPLKLPGQQCYLLMLINLGPTDSTALIFFFFTDTDKWGVGRLNIIMSFYLLPAIE